MKLELFNEETNKIWKQVSSGPNANRLQFELDIYKKLLNFFQVGGYYYIIFNIGMLDFDYTSPQVEAVLGYKVSEFNRPLFMEIIHPDDRPWLLAYETKASEFLMSLPLEKLMKYKIRYDYRLKNKGGGYTRILHQSVIVEHDNDGRITRTLSVETDITHLKPEGKPVFSIIGMDGEVSYLDINVKNKFTKSSETLTRREKQVLTLLIEGKLSKEIGIILNIRKQTVDMHRKNMLRKNNLSTTGELIGKAIRQGWL